MVTDKIKQLAATRAKLANLEQSVASEMKAELARLPAKYGFGSTEDFLSAVRAAAGGGRGRKPGRPKGKGPGRGAPGRKRRKRAVITDETRAQVKKMVA